MSNYALEAKGYGSYSCQHCEWKTRFPSNSRGEALAFGRLTKHEKSHDLYSCPSCGNSIVPREKTTSGILFYLCPKCDFSTWEPGDWEPV